MAPRFDFRKTLRGIAIAAQDANLDRLLTGQAVRGGEVPPQRGHAAPKQGRRKRVRLLGVRVALADVAGRLGVKTGELLKDVTRRANIKVGRVSFKIVPSPSVILRWRAFVAGTKHQAARPISGLTAQQLGDAAALLAADAREQLTRNMQAELEALRTEGD